MILFGDGDFAVRVVGETVVGGNVVPDEFIIHKEKLTIIEKKIASKNKKMICDDNGTKIISTTNEEKFKQSLPDKFILVLANYVKKLEQFFCEVYNKKLYQYAKTFKNH